jgi:hypothetical protein
MFSFLHLCTQTKKQKSMNTAQAYFEIYKSLPNTVKSKVFSMILKEKSPILAEVEVGLTEVVQMQKGAKPKRNVRDLIESLRNE